jgi:RNA polymerase sigma-70 factor (ECF subfamily)
VSDPAENWAALVEQLAEGDRVAFLKLSRLVTGFLVQLRAYDFRDDWPDLIQEVITALLVAAREGKIREPRAVVGYARQVTRYKFLDRLERKERRRERHVVPLEDVDTPEHRDQADGVPRDEVVVDVRRALEKLPEAKRAVVFGVYGEGKTYDQVVEETGIPLGSVKRYLRQGLAELREIFNDVEEE